MRTSALALLCLVATTDGTNLRGGQTEVERRLGCFPKGSQVYIDMALAANLDPAIWADTFYDVCMQAGAPPASTGPVTAALPLTPAATTKAATTAAATTKAATTTKPPTPASVASTPPPSPWYVWPTPPGGLPNCDISITTRCVRNDGSGLDCSEPVAPNTKQDISIYFYITNTGTVRAQFQQFTALFTDDRRYNYGIANSTTLGPPLYILPGNYHAPSVRLNSVQMDSQGHRTIYANSTAVATNRLGVECKASNVAEIRVGFS